MSNMYTRCMESKPRLWAIVWRCGDSWQGTLPMTASEAVREFVIAHAMGVQVTLLKLVGDRSRWYSANVRDGGWSLLASRRVWSA